MLSGKTSRAETLVASHSVDFHFFFFSKKQLNALNEGMSWCQFSACIQIILLLLIFRFKICC